MATVHNSANVGDIAKNCVICGDPLRAKLIAENFLEDAKLINTVRNMFGYTGKYKGKEVTVMGHGMGMASISIYSHELYKFYGVKNIIRAGSCGGFDPKLKLFDTIIVDKAYTTSNIGEQLGVGTTRVLESSRDLFNKAVELTKGKENCYVGDILSSDVFYVPNDDETDKHLKLGCLAVEMEAFALNAVAKLNGGNALTILTVSDIVGTKEETTSEQRQNSFKNMLKIALDVLVEMD